MDKRTVHVVGRYSDYERMFEANGWLVVDNIEDDADLVQFCGGSDVSPSLYNETAMACTYSDHDRDEYEVAIFQMALEYGVPIAGICRGGQFVHVMNGGKMWQDVNNHALANGHSAMIVNDKFKTMALPGGRVWVSSTHHQMMKGGVGVPLLEAGMSTRRDSFGETEVGPRYNDLEAAYYKETNSLSFQPHPEFFDVTHPCQKLYFAFIDSLLFGLEV